MKKGSGHFSKFLLFLTLLLIIVGSFVIFVSNEVSNFPTGAVTYTTQIIPPTNQQIKKAEPILGQGIVITGRSITDTTSEASPPITGAATSSISSITGMAAGEVTNTYNLNPTDDSFVAARQPTRNYGGASDLRIDGSPILISYMKFDLRPYAGKQITRAILRMYITDSSNSIQNVKQSADIAWTENSINYNNRPELTSIIAQIDGNTPGNAVGSWIELDLMNYIPPKAGQLATIGIDSSGRDKLAAYSSESTLGKPELVIDVVEPGTTPPAPSYQCSDTLDNDNDGPIDYPNDKSCSSSTDNDETVPQQCSDTFDNDGDGPIDMNDKSCSSSTDNDETVPQQCSDTWDNDNDGLTDYPSDTGCTSSTGNDETNAPPSGGSGFVQRQGSKLVLNGNNYTFIGFNLFGAANDAAIGKCGNANNDGNNPNEFLDSAFSVHKQYNYNAVRIWAFQKFTVKTVNGVKQRDWTAIDRVISKAKANNMKVMLSLENHWGDCTNSGQKNDAWYSSGYSTTISTGDINNFKNYAIELATHYKDETGVLMYEIINEPEMSTSSNYNTLRTFADDVATAIHNADPNHLVTVGTIGTGQKGLENTDAGVGCPLGSCYRNFYSLSSLDVCSAHDYNRPEVAWPNNADGWHGIAKSYDDCMADGKPFALTENGIRDQFCDCRNGGYCTWDPTCYSKDQRSTYFNAKLDAAFNQHEVDGYLPWQWDNDNVAGHYGTNCANYDDYCVFNGDPLLDVMKNYAPATCSPACNPDQYCDAGTCKYTCSDTHDNDNDGKTDYGTGSTNDPGCSSSTDTTEYGTAICDNNQDETNDADGLADYKLSGGDPGCTSVTDSSEVDALCDNTQDDDNDGKTDYGTGSNNDPGCTGYSDNDEYNAPVYQCNDGSDNDNDGPIDYPNDKSCSSSTDNDETVPQQCSDTFDNDGDSLTDHPSDPGCTGPTDNVETDPGTLLTTPPNFKVAFIGDSGKDAGFESVLNLVRDEGADMAILPGDLSYGSTAANADAWAQDIRNILDPYWQSSGKMSEFGTNCNLFPFFISQGNHDTGSQWTDPNTGYRKFLKDRLNCHGVVWDDAGHNGDWLGTRSSWAYQNLFMTSVAHEGELGGANQAEVAQYVYNKMNNNQYLWDIAFMHRQQAAMQVGDKGDSTGWDLFENARKAGAITLVAHSHVYGMTWVLDSMSTQHVVDNLVPLTIWNEDPGRNRIGRTFNVDAGSGGIGVRSQTRCAGNNNYQYPYGCNGEWASVMSTQDANYNHGAYFIEFNVDGDPRKARSYFKTAGSNGVRWNEPGTQDDDPTYGGGVYTIYNDATVV